MTQRMNENLLKAMFLALLFICLLLKLLYQGELSPPRGPLDAARQEAPGMKSDPAKPEARLIDLKEVFRRH